MGSPVCCGRLATALWGEAFSPDGQILAVAYTDRIFLWDVASTAWPRLLRTLTVVVDRQEEANVVSGYSNVSRGTVFRYS
jgi:hypothetical protein